MARAMKVVGAVVVFVVAIAAGSRVMGRVANGLRSAPNGNSGV